MFERIKKGERGVRTEIIKGGRPPISLQKGTKGTERRSSVK